MKLRTTLLASFCVAVLVSMCGAQAAVADDSNSESVAKAIQDRYQTDGFISGSTIEVTVNDGVARLNGEVETLLEKDRATYLAEEVSGVQKVNNLLVVNPPRSLSDRDLGTAVRNALQRDPVADTYEIQSYVANGTVTLNGSVESQPEKRLVERAVKGVPGVRDVVNDLDVNIRISRPASEIKPEIEERLQWDAFVDEDSVDVQVNEGLVTLSGTVDSAAEKRRAEMDAYVAAGVDGIISDDLTVVASR